MFILRVLHICVLVMLGIGIAENARASTVYCGMEEVGTSQEYGSCGFIMANGSTFSCAGSLVSKEQCEAHQFGDCDPCVIFGQQAPECQSTVASTQVFETTLRNCREVFYHCDQQQEVSDTI